MRRSAVFFLAVTLLPFNSIFAEGQQEPVTPFASVANYGIDSVNLQTLTPMYTLPVHSAGGIGAAVEGAAMCITTGGGVNTAWSCGNGLLAPWQPTSVIPGPITQSLGFPGYVVSLIASSKTQATCPGSGTTTYVYNYQVLVFGMTSILPLPSSAKLDTQDCLYTSFTATTTDGSGLTVQATNSVSGQTFTVTDKFGRYETYSTAQTYPYPSTFKDPFGNTISLSNWNGYSGGKYYGLLNTTQPVLNVTASNGWQNDGFQYYDATGTSQSITVTTQTLTLWTNFGCSGIKENQGGTQTFGTAVNYPDSTSVQIGYEHVGSGYTGRFNSLTTRQGGTITYGYGPMNCTYHVPTTLTRHTSDGTWTYSFKSISSNQSVTKVLDPGGNETDYTFTGFQPASGQAPVVTQIQRYQSNGSTNSLVSTDTICYNGNTSNCTSATVNYPITEKQVTHQIAGMTPTSQTFTYYDGGPNGGCAKGTAPCYGNVTEVDSLDFSASSPTFYHTITYGSWNGTSCQSIGSGVYGKVCYDNVSDSNGNLISSTDYAYNTKGFMTGQLNWTGQCPNGVCQFLSTSYSPNSNGTVKSMVAPNGTTYNYTYTGTNGCNSLLPTSVTAPGGTINIQYECNGGTVTQTQDVNQNWSYASFDDPLFRLTSATDNSGLSVSVNPYTSTTVTSTSSFNGASLTTIGTVDGLGRPIQTQISHGSSYDVFGSSYDGFVADNSEITYKTHTLTPCTTTTPPCTGTASTLYVDALGRSVESTNGNGVDVVYSYGGTTEYDVTASDKSKTPNPTVTTEYDGLGRVRSVCGILSSGGTSCGQSVSGSGIPTSFTYSTASGQATVQSKRTDGTNTQLHTTVFDALGRPLTVTTPEAGTVTYYYDSVTASLGDTCGARTYNGSLLDLKLNDGTIVCYLYNDGGFGRATDVGNTNSPTTPCRRFRYDIASNGVQSAPSGYPTSGANTVGRLVEAETDNCTGPYVAITDEWFAYDKNGRVTDVWEMTTHSGGYYHTTATYFLSGAVNTLSGIPGYPTMTWSGTSASPMTLDTDGNVGALVTGTFNMITSVDRSGNPFQNPGTVNIGNNSDKDTYTWDLTTGNMKTWSDTVNGQAQNGTLTWNANGTLGTLAISDAINSGGAQTCSFTYDDVLRLTNDTCATGGTTIWQQGFSYDFFDNLNKSGNSAWTTLYDKSKNQYLGIGATYDSNGRITYDGVSSHYTWNAYGQVATATSGGTVTCGSSGVCFTYDALGNIVEKSSNSTYYEYLRSPMGTIARMQGASTVNYAYIPAPGGGNAYFTGSTGGNHYLQHPDWLGSVRLQSYLTGSSSSAYFDRAYAPYGEEYDGFGNGPANNQVFAGLRQEDDPALGLFDTPNRELQPVQGRWLSPDPAGASWNAYEYATNPNSFVDPTGLNLMLGGGGCDSENFDCNPGAGPGMGNGGDCSDASCGNQGTDPSSECPICIGPFGQYGTAGIYGGWMSLAFGGFGGGSEDPFALNQFVSGVVPILPLAADPDAQFGIWVLVARKIEDVGTTRSQDDPYAKSPLSQFLKKLIFRPYSFGILLPIEIPAGPAGSFSFDLDKGFACLGLGGGVGARGVNGGPLWGNIQNSANVLSGWSVSVNVAGPIGAQIIQNLSGKLFGPTVGAPGASLAITYSWCSGK